MKPTAWLDEDILDLMQTLYNESLSAETTSAAAESRTALQANVMRLFLAALRSNDLDLLPSNHAYIPPGRFAELRPFVLPEEPSKHQQHEGLDLYVATYRA